MKASEYFGDWMGVIDTQELYRVVSWIGKLDKTTLCPASQNIFRASQAELMLKKTFDDFDMDTFVRRHIETQMRYWTTDSVRHQVANLLADRLVILSEDNEKINDSKHQLKN
jgi:hypothetical protein